MVEAYLRQSIALATANIAAGGGPFGSVIVRDGVVLAEGANRVTALQDPTAHAEVVAIRVACERLGTYSLEGCTIYASCEPCPMCLGAILWARIDRIFFAASHEEAAAAGFDDSAFYRELAKPATEREVPMVRALASEGREPFTAWSQFSAKVPY